MREIKFRAWHKEDKVMVYDLNSPRLIHGELKDDTYEFMQFTGILDRDGNEIFESDILDVGDNNIYLVEYKRDRFCLSQYVGYDIHHEDCSDGYYRICLSAYCKESKIIGSVHENQELLENK